MSKLDAVFKGVGFLASIVGGVVERIGTAVKQWGENVLRDFQVTYGGNVKPRNPRETLNNLEVIDAEFVEIEKKRQRDGVLSKRDKDKFEELNHLKKQEFDEYQRSQVIQSAIEQVSNPDDYKSTLLDTEKVHILQYQMGQIVLEKKCYACGRPMFLQHKNRPDGSLFILSDFFWSCVGFYDNNPATRCIASQPFQTKDLGLLHKVDIPELNVSNSDLSIIYTQKNVQQSVSKRVKDHIRSKDNDILCKVHYIPMILRGKREHNGSILDMYYLGCQHPGCKQVVKLKSPAQLAAFLRRNEGRGIF
jgi:hypothetical protein